MSASLRAIVAPKSDKYGKYRAKEKKRRARRVRDLVSPLQRDFDCESGKALGKRARHTDGDFVVKRLRASEELAALCLLRQDLLAKVFFCQDTSQSDTVTRLMRAKSERLPAKPNENCFFSLRTYVPAKPLAQWLTKKVSFMLLYDTAMQKFVCKIFLGVFVRHIIGLSDDNGRGVAKHILVAQRPRRVLHISLDGDEDTRNVMDTYLDKRTTVFELLRSARWPVEVRESFGRLCKTPDCRMRMLYALNDMSENGVWHNVYDFVERYGMLTKINVLSMQARLYQLRTALQKQNIC